MLQGAITGAKRWVIVTIQELGIALDAANRINYAERLKKLSDQRIVFIFDECHRSQFGLTHKAIKEFFPLAEMSGFTGTLIFEENSTTGGAGRRAEIGLTLDRRGFVGTHLLSASLTAFTPS